ncbi:hypothetical protein TWF225_003871 [Orbilia oligospora]|nr:hypothetical protein TWF225_003871 [Orbilia oligospora]KAF3248601.1 hypothetical protein TWF128_008318 [Orbilia oligospora]KAF3258644.1 hypothetical protein TWF217_005416 [Orbilia oligospora]KAF3295510.1 hypothetical protein TWF132_001554 [Orbilia oligospora]
MSLPEMAAIATVLNPGNPSKILTWMNRPDSSLGLEIRSIKDKDEDKEYKSPAAVGAIKNPSSIATFVVEHMANVYAIGNDDFVYRLSPTIEKIDDASVAGNVASLAGTSDGEQAWLYYLTGGKKQITEYQVDDGPNQTLVNEVCYEKTYIAATYNADLKRRWVAFQLTGGQIKVMNLDKGTNYTIGDSSQSKLQTPLAMCYVSSGSDGKGGIFVYYTNKDGQLLRAYKTTALGDDSAFSASVNFGNDARTVSQFSQISVTAAPDSNIVTYISGAGKNRKLTKFLDLRS